MGDDRLAHLHARLPGRLRRVARADAIRPDCARSFSNRTASVSSPSPAWASRGAQITAEVGVFTVVTMLAARFEPAVLAAHQIALNSAAFTFMVPLGLSSAAAVRVGQALGRGDAEGASRAGWAALGLGLAFMATTASLPLGPGSDPPALHVRRAGARERRRAAADRRCLSALRRDPGGADRRAPRHGRHADADAREPRRLLDPRTPARRPPLLSERRGCRRALGRPLHGPRHGGRDARGGVDLPQPPPHAGDSCEKGICVGAGLVSS
jgi:hypothetical protein